MGRFLLTFAILALVGCAQAPAPDPYGPWFNIPRPTSCGAKCQQWIEPGMMVKP